MKTFLSTFALFFFIQTLFAQQTIQGKVVKEFDDTPLQSASIYINNSSKGTTSMADGSFSLQADNWINVELIVSCVGYEPVVFRINSADAKKNYLVKLTAKSSEMEPVLIINDAQRAAYLKTFRENFLGITSEADQSNIANMKSIYFIAGTGNKGSFTAKTDEPLEIINKKLGYKLSFDLISFTYDPVQHSTSFFGYTRYESLGEGKKYLKSRAAAYYGSTMHFFRSLLNGSYAKEGYSLMLIKKMKNMNVGYKITDSALLRPNDKDSSVKNLNFPGQLQVIYLQETLTRRYLSEKGILLPGYKNSTSQFQIQDSAIIFLSHDGSIINPENIIVSGYWGYEKVASLLPVNFIPDEKYKPKTIAAKSIIIQN